WTTPPVANQWWNTHTRYGGYHGYWAEDFMSVDKHVGTLEEYRLLAERLHARGMYLIQDVVLNHTANYFRYDGAWDAADPTRNFVLVPDSAGRTAPTQWPFKLNDVRDPAQRKAAIYHWTPTIGDVNRRDEELTFQLGQLDDLNTENPVVRTA